MARDYTGGSPKHHHLESKKKRLTWIFGVSALCVVCYMLGAWQTTPSPVNRSELYQRVGCDETHHQVDINKSEAVQKFPACDMAYSEYTPCQDPQRGRKFDRKMLKYRERHCPTKEEQLLCLIPAPPKYKTPFKWPQSRDFAWYDNIPHRELSIEEAVQNWIQVEGDRFRFPGGGTMFPRGAGAYIDDIDALIPLSKGNIRTAIDTGCGVSIIDTA
ncbi:putative methyltransferase PMT18 [Prunus yedoensis var. nudiflora]|uniref:Methyltransferase n=1 Tax=Prunus yedoensis var. nudiflora TaxID=2094558 RepID=A0A314XL84_PRUYE|nr:putative methyltransferase PMT18 [Prunus yedoensis var. nudiflora]